MPLNEPVWVKIVSAAILDLPTFTIAIGIFFSLEIFKTLISLLMLVKPSAYIPIAVTLLSFRAYSIVSSILILAWFPNDMIYPIGRDLWLKLIVFPIVPLWQIIATPLFVWLPATWSDHTETLSK